MAGRFLLLFLCLTGLVTPAATAGVAEGVEPETIRITRADCQRLVTHRARADVAYQEGVDSRGRAVVPADLEGAPKLALPEIYRVRIEVDTADRLDIPSDPDRYDGDIEVGVAEVHPDGRVFFNGRPLQSDEAFALSRACQEKLEEND